MAKEIKVTCESNGLMPIAELDNFQGDLKTLDDESFKKLKISIVKYGFSFPIFTWNGNILDGHQRLKAVKSLIDEGYTLDGDLLPVDRIEAKNEKEAAEKLLLINSRYAKIDQSGFDLFVENFDLDIADLSDMLDIPEVDFSFGDEEFEGNTDPDDVPEVEETPVTKMGDLWILGSHRLMCGNSTKIEDVERLMDGQKADICLTDPPYGIAATKNSKGNYDIFEDTLENVIELSKKWLPIARQICKVVVFSSGVTRQWIYPEPDWVLSWFYGGGQLRSQWGFNCWQPFLAYGKDPSLASTNGCRPDAIDLNVPSNASDINHPCPKPVKLWIWFIERLSFKNTDLFYEPFSGSGTTIIATQQTNRKCYAMEISPQYVDVAIKRWQDFTGNDAVLERTGETFEMIKNAVTP